MLTEVGTAPVQPLGLQPPAWVYRLMETRGGAAPGDAEAGAMSECGRFVLLARRIGGVADLPPERFIAAVDEAYRSLGRELERLNRQALRLWNFIPGIHTPVAAMGDRYRAFNAGRLDGYADWFRDPRTLPDAVPTSSAVGIEGDTFWVYVLGADAAGLPVENPRQIPSYRYSSRYGARPPCFARATRFESLLLIGGTASILGEDTCHDGDIEAQTRETIRNIASLVAHGREGRPAERPLDALRDIRVHVVRREHDAAVAAVLGELLPGLQECEFVQAELCRQDLLVEIEGTAHCP